MNIALELELRACNHRMEPLSGDTFYVISDSGRVLEVEFSHPVNDIPNVPSAWQMTNGVAFMPEHVYAMYTKEEIPEEFR